jgi:hypothetical protein
VVNMSLCPSCQGELTELRGKLICSACHTIIETCCEGGRCTYSDPPLDRWKEMTKASAEKYNEQRNKTAH